MGYFILDRVGLMRCLKWTCYFFNGICAVTGGGLLFVFVPHGREDPKKEDSSRQDDGNETDGSIFNQPTDSWKKTGTFTSRLISSLSQQTSPGLSMAHLRYLTPHARVLDR